MKRSARKPKPGITAVTPKSARRVAEELDLEDVARLGSLDLDRPGERVRETEVELRAVRMRALAGEQAGDSVLDVERELVSRRDRDDRRDVRMPAVVHQRSSPTRAAARVHAAASASVHDAGRAELVERDDRGESLADEDRRHDLRGEAAVGLEHRLERRVVEGGPAVVLDDLAPLLQLEDDGLAASDRPCAPLAATARRARAPRG